MPDLQGFPSFFDVLWLYYENISNIRVADIVRDRAKNAEEFLIRFYGYIGCVFAGNTLAVYEMIFNICNVGSYCC